MFADARPDDNEQESSSAAQDTSDDERTSDLTVTSAPLAPTTSSSGCGNDKENDLRLHPPNRNPLKRKNSQPLSPDSPLVQTSIKSFYTMLEKKPKRDWVSPMKSTANDSFDHINAQLISSMVVNGRRLVPCIRNLSDAEIAAYQSAYVESAESDTSSSIISNLTYLHTLSKNRRTHRPAAVTSAAAAADKKEYTVEHILQMNEIDGEPHFLIKWRGWPHSANTWEPLENVRDCDRFVNYIASEIVNFHDEIEHIAVMSASATDDQATGQESDDDDAVMFERLRDFDELHFQSNLLVLAHLHRDAPGDHENEPVYGRMQATLQRDLQLLTVHMRRMRQLEQLQAFEQHINATDKSSKLTVENLVDFDGPPERFEYINDVFAGDGVTIPDDPRIGCTCAGGECNYWSQCCAKEANSSFAYNKRGRIRVPPGTPVFECNRHCACDSTCMNRVVQQGRQHSLCIFKTANGCGWSVRTLRTIWKGQFICEYVGEVVTHEEAERRGQIYDAKGQTYLFDLDINTMDNLYTIDAAFHGNVSHFINHSCDPNCGVWAVYIDCVDLDLPRLGLFSTRKIEAGEELNFDYQSNPASGVVEQCSDELDSADRKKKQMECRCGSIKCRKYIF